MSQITIESPRIIQDENLLRQKCEEVSLEEGTDIASKLMDVLDVSKNGAAIAAPQIGINKRVFVAKVNDDNFMLAFINPVIIEKSNPFVFKEEGCLSFPGQRINTIRYKDILVQADNFAQIIKMTDFISVVVQHEENHLNGILMFDNKVPESYDKCFCGSEKKFKFCCQPNIK